MHPKAVKKQACVACVIPFALQYLIKTFEKEFKMVVLDSYNMETYVEI